MAGELIETPPDAIVLHRVVIPMRSPFAASHGVETNKHATIVEVRRAGISGWGECAALEHPTYTDEFADGAFRMLQDTIAPAALQGSKWASASPGDPMAKAGLGLALLDCGLRRGGVSLVAHLEEITGTPARRLVPAGLSLGISHDLDELVANVANAIVEGYQRIRLKIDRNWDHQPLEAVRSLFPDAVVQVDANGSYTTDDFGRLRELERYTLLMIEQPLPTGDLEGHAALARVLNIPICLDEPIVSAQTAQETLLRKAASVINIKVARLGGLQATLDTLAVCRSLGAGAWCGGMLDTGIGRAVNVAVASLDGFTSPGDIAGTDRYFDRDIITTRFRVSEGYIAVPDGPGIGVEIDHDALAAFTIKRVELVRPQRARG